MQFLMKRCPPRRGNNSRNRENYMANFESTDHKKEGGAEYSNMNTSGCRLICIQTLIIEAC